MGTGYRDWIVESISYQKDPESNLVHCVCLAHYGGQRLHRFASSAPTMAEAIQIVNAQMGAHRLKLEAEAPEDMSLGSPVSSISDADDLPF